MKIISAVRAGSVPARLSSPSIPSVEEVLEPLFRLRNPSLLARRQRVTVSGLRYELPKFLLLGARGGGVPIRVGLLAGFEAEGLETVAAVAHLLGQWTANPGQARDYAVFGYPLVNAPGFGPALQSHSALLRRWSERRDDADGRFYRGELARQEHHLLLHFRRAPAGQPFHATTRSALLAREVIAPALQSARRVAPVAAEPVRVLADSLEARAREFAAGRLTPNPARGRRGLEVALYAPAGSAPEARRQALIEATQEILRGYRRFIAYGGEL